MSVADLSRRAADPAVSKAFTCPHYVPAGDGKRCKDYQEGGTCARPDLLLCSEWEKRNRHRLPKSKSATADAAPTDLFGNPLPEPKQKPARLRAESLSAPSRSASSLSSTTSDNRPPPRGLTAEDIDSFKKLGVEVCLESEAFGEVWLVPEYTGRDRKEITPEHAATIARVMEAFPGSKVVSFEKSQKPNKEAK
jgi:hypothetical protein